MKRDYRLFLNDIIAAMESIEGFVGDMTLEELKADEKTSSAVITKIRRRRPNPTLKCGVCSDACCDRRIFGMLRDEPVSAT